MKSLFIHKLLPPSRGWALSKVTMSEVNNIIVELCQGWVRSILFKHDKWVVALSPWSCVGWLIGAYILSMFESSGSQPCEAILRVVHTSIPLS